LEIDGDDDEEEEEEEESDDGVEVYLKNPGARHMVRRFNLEGGKRRKKGFRKSLEAMLTETGLIELC